MYARYGDIEQNDLIADLGDALPHFIYWLMTKVGLIEIATDNDNYAYAIFETMNDRGKPLSPVDMLKAYLLAPVEDAEQRRKANQIWKQQVLDLISWGGSMNLSVTPIASRPGFVAQYAEPSGSQGRGCGQGLGTDRFSVSSVGEGQPRARLGLVQHAEPSG